MNIYRFVTWLLATALLLATSGPVLAQDYDPAETLVYSFPSNVGPLNPHLYEPNQMFAQAMVYDPLVQLKSDGSLGPGLAESWDISPDGLVYTFKIRPEVSFSDGQTLDAVAVVKNFKAIVDNAKRHAWLGLTDKIQSYEATGPLEFKLTLKEPYYPALRDLSLPRPFRMLSPAAFPDDGDTAKGFKAPVGTGPWKLVEIALGRYDRFERNDTYWGDKAKSPRILVKVIPDPVSRALAFEAGEIDLIYGLGQVNFDTFSRFSNSTEINTALSGPMGTMSVALNSARGPTSELAVRQALQHVIDKEAIIRGVTLNTKLPAHSLFAPEVPYCDVNLPKKKFDVELASQILDKAGWKLGPGKKIREKNGQSLLMDFSFVGNNPVHKALAEVFQAQALKAGISLNLLGEEPDSFLQRQRQGNFDLTINPTWGPPYEPHAQISSMLVPSHADYMAQSGLPMKDEIHRLIKNIMASTEEAQRAEMYGQLLTILHDQAIYLPLYYDTLASVHRPERLSGVSFGPANFHIPFSEISVK